jgi:hypothetical protein
MGTERKHDIYFVLNIGECTQIQATEVNVAELEILSRHLTGENEEKREKPASKTDFRAEEIDDEKKKNE